MESKKKTKRQQFARLVALLEKNPEIARGDKFVQRETVTQVWWTITDQLNSLGPPTRSVAAWQKVWADKKRTVKTKLQHNRNEVRATGGGPNTLNSFNDVEESIVRLLSLERTVDHNGAVFGTQNLQPISAPVDLQPTSAPVDLQDDNQATIPCDPEPEPEDEPMHAVPETDSGRAVSTPRSLGRRSNRNFRKVLLGKQTDDLAEIKQHASDSARYARKSFYMHEKRYELEKKRFELEKEKFLFKKELMLAKQKQQCDQLEYQKQMLEYKKQKLDFEMRRAPGENADLEGDKSEDTGDESDEGSED